MYQRLSREELDNLHAASFQVMEESGVRLLDEQAVSILRKAGCRVDDNALVRFPTKLVDWALNVDPMR